MNFKYYNTQRLIILILIISFLIAPLSAYLENWISKIKLLSTVYSYVGIFSTITILTLVLLLINNCLWKTKFFKWLVNIPNLNGRYEGELISTFTDQQNPINTKKKCIVEIKQTASKIKLHIFFGDVITNTQTSQANSISEEIIEQSNGIFEIFYIYSNNANSIQTQLNNHIGTCSLKYFSDIKVLDGEYYNQRGFKGNIRVQFTQRKTLGRLL
ncbi:hypothetical protein CMU78_05925 [Elizabethkingia anophelis]|uniref:Cap15 family cyclic dinucleotide receptor domain-containing protein n=1 Tax=Elizabethkingia sp. M8 TaxID=2796140 RepID=UPI001906E323|nr:hypothetical protein [Elizabethkingia sp. M8]MDV3627812.1 hypothetical protein [Elizabethkingia anophelis]MDV3688110.1 hypothetical protein [Elizabethkingia anophelis]MDV3785213.1 hypothetical protein [Elizabethkingia anophelis]MDV3809419.1 hypothetical protein [Elizabethkingia anophelis]MDV3817277.1 hypothetical protein [Elizabethkingia anophelis]